MNKLTHLDIIPILFIPSFLLAKVIGTEIFFRSVFSAQSVYFSQENIVLVSVVMGTVAIFTYTSISRVLSFIPRVSDLLSKLIAYAVSIILMILGWIITMRYVLTELSSTPDHMSLIWPATLGLSSDPVIFYLNNFLVNIVGGVVIAFLAAVVVKKLLGKLEGKKLVVRLE